MARVLRDMTQYDIGSKVGVTLQQIQKYERGCNRLSASKLWDLSRALGVDISYFFQGYGADDYDAVAHHSNALDLNIDAEAMLLAKAFARIKDTKARNAMLAWAKAMRGEEETCLGNG